MHMFGNSDISNTQESSLAQDLSLLAHSGLIQHVEKQKIADRRCRLLLLKQSNRMSPVSPFSHVGLILSVDAFEIDQPCGESASDV